jgi:hypothetical protein
VPIVFPAAAEGMSSLTQKPALYPALPTVPLDETCDVVDPALGRCQMPTTRHDIHRIAWDGFEGSWRTGPAPLWIAHPV